MKDNKYLSNQYHENRDLFYRNGKSYTKVVADLWEIIKDIERDITKNPFITQIRAQELLDEHKDLFNDKIK